MKWDGNDSWKCKEAKKAYGTKYIMKIVSKGWNPEMLYAMAYVRYQLEY